MPLARPLLPDEPQRRAPRSRGATALRVELHRRQQTTPQRRAPRSRGATTCCTTTGRSGSRLNEGLPDQEERRVSVCHPSHLPVCLNEGLPDQEERLGAVCVGFGEGNPASTKGSPIKRSDRK